MKDLDIRWQQRFAHFEKAFSLLRDVVRLGNPTVNDRAALIHFFEMAFEQGWKLLKDFEEAEGFIETSPRGAIKRAFQTNLIASGHDWIEALEDRNLTTHTYNEETAIAVENKIREKYFPFLQRLHQDFEARVS
jgi:nucleotidyltransferase substrate binding protein (TIGR01987 family)